MNGGPEVEERFWRLAALAFALLHVAIWTATPLLANGALPLDVAETVAWGPDFRLTYPKHPPLSPWLAQAALRIGGASDWALYLLPQLCVLGVMAASWALLAPSAGPRIAASGVVGSAAIYHLGFVTPEFNANVAQYPFWMGAAWLGFRAFSGGGAAWWVGFGLACGLGALAKYSFLALPATIAAWSLSDRRARAAWSSSGPWIAAGCAAAICAPHAIALAREGFGAIGYALERAGSAGAWTDHVIHPAKFAAAMALAAAPLAAIFAWAAQGGSAGAERRLRIYAAFVFLGPIALYCAFALATGVRLRSMWGAAAMSAAPLFLAAWAAPRAERGARRALIACVAMALFANGAYAAIATLGPRLSGEMKRTTLDARALGARARELWRGSAGETPLAIVVADEWLGGTIARSIAGHRIETFVRGDPEIARWLSEDEVRTRGALLAWRAGEPPSFAERLAPFDARASEPIGAYWGGVEPLPIELAVVLPARGDGLSDE